MARSLNVPKGNQNPYIEEEKTIIVLSFPLRYTDSDYPLVHSNFWPLYCLFFFDIRILITLWYIQTFGHCIVFSSSIYGFWLPFGTFKLLAIVLSFLLRYTDSDYPLVHSNWRRKDNTMAKILNVPKGNQNPYIEEEKTIQ
jgi:hypothetical protein